MPTRARRFKPVMTASEVPTSVFFGNECQGASEPRSLIKVEIMTRLQRRELRCLYPLSRPASHTPPQLSPSADDGAVELSTTQQGPCRGPRRDHSHPQLQSPAVGKVHTTFNLGRPIWMRAPAAPGLVQIRGSLRLSDERTIFVLKRHPAPRLQAPCIRRRLNT
jgi:hypothetical protein